MHVMLYVVDWYAIKQLWFMPLWYSRLFLIHHYQDHLRRSSLLSDPVSVFLTLCNSTSSSSSSWYASPLPSPLSPPNSGSSVVVAGTVFPPDSSLMPMITLPVTNMAAPSHHSPGSDSLKMMKLSTAVTMKLADVLIMLTRTVEEARVRARVKRPHMMALKSRLRPKKSCALWLG